jgi:hypothetical protein
MAEEHDASAGSAPVWLVFWAGSFVLPHNFAPVQLVLPVFEEFSVCFVRVKHGVLVRLRGNARDEHELSAAAAVTGTAVQRMVVQVLEALGPLVAAQLRKMCYKEVVQ